MHYNAITPVSDWGKYQPNAVARNELVDIYLRPRHSHVLWIDADIVTAPPDLIEQLMDVSDGDVVAPMVYVEKLDEDKPMSFGNGGWFYDVGGFVQNGRGTSQYNPHFDGGEVVELDSVGSCYLIPAACYRQGARYSARGSTVEHVAFMAQMREMGYRVLAKRSLVVEHAYLPKWGEQWH